MKTSKIYIVKYLANLRLQPTHGTRLASKLKTCLLVTKSATATSSPLNA